ncbi:MAG TPA: primosomal protein N' [Tenuifilaceae bacterium]|nr:primosomal protein N' [Tenuifilaceae bacterium]HPI44346.1 primosomal protein N' [Tenuifilaceae bacterium]HPN21970.1 primosomal protein N' [Tenuifilaceae bacterium]
MPENWFVDVVLPLALPKTYTYSIPSSLAGEIKVGMRVVVSFGKKKLYAALVYRVHQHAPENYQTKDILQLIDETPIVLPTQLKFWEWIADYYMCTLGEVMKAALPSALKMESDTYIGRTELEDIDLTDNEQIILHLLDSKKKLTIQDIVSKVDFKNPMGVIKSLLNKQAISINEEIENDYQPKVEYFISLSQEYRTNDALNTLLEGMKRAPAQQKLILALLSLADNPKEMLNFRVSKKLIQERVDVSTGVLAALIQKGVLVQEEQTLSRLSSSNDDTFRPATLNETQKEALLTIQEMFQSQNVALLHGVTSSGKTEVYIHLIQEAVSNGKQVLYLLPEIALTAQIINRLRKIFGNRVGVYHSKFSDSQRVEVYNGVLATDANLANFDIILGVRSSVFLPYRNLGLIIVDEEHENTYKQYNPAPRYNARDAAIVLASIHNAKVLLGTATPSIETYFNARTGKYGLVELSERYLGMELPEIRVVDVRDARKRKQMKSHFSDVLLREIDVALSNNEQVILFQNRRGFAPFIECGECAWVPHCDHCDVTLTYHKSTNQLVCHYCGYSYQQPHECLACGSSNLQPKGFGTEKVEDELSIFFPNAVIERVDLDSTRSRTAYERIIGDFESGHINILIGTQMITKGLDFDKVSLVGILNADNMLNFPDFRAFERSFQLMSQVSGRAGRKGRKGLVIMQTAQPEHPVIKQIIQHDYLEHYASQIEERKNFHYPPYYRLINIALKHKDKELLNQASDFVAKGLRHNLGDNVLGPEPPLIGRVQGLFIMNILVKINREQPLSRIKELINYYINGLKQRKELYALVASIDVDPQ